MYKIKKDDIKKAILDNNEKELIIMFNGIIDSIFTTYHQNTNSFDKDDLRQEALIVMYKSIKNCDCSKNAFNYFFTIAFHKINKKIKYVHRTVHTNQDFIRYDINEETDCF